MGYVILLVVGILHTMTHRTLSLQRPYVVNLNFIGQELNMIIYTYIILGLISVLTIIYGIKSNGKQFFSGFLGLIVYLPIMGRVLGWWQANLNTYILSFDQL